MVNFCGPLTPPHVRFRIRRFLVINNQSVRNDRLEQGDESQVIEVGDSKHYIHVLSTRVPPRAPSIVSALHSVIVIKSSSYKALVSGLGTLPLTPQDQTQSSAKPHIQFLGHCFNFAKPVVISPASKERIEVLCNEPAKVPTPPLSKEKLSFLTEPFPDFLRDCESDLFPR